MATRAYALVRVEKTPTLQPGVSELIRSCGHIHTHSSSQIGLVLPWRDGDLRDRWICGVRRSGLGVFWEIGVKTYVFSKG